MQELKRKCSEAAEAEDVTLISALQLSVGHPCFFTPTFASALSMYVATFGFSHEMSPSVKHITAFGSSLQLLQVAVTDVD